MEIGNLKSQTINLHYSHSGLYENGQEGFLDEMYYETGERFDEVLLTQSYSMCFGCNGHLHLMKWRKNDSQLKEALISLLTQDLSKKGRHIPQKIACSENEDYDEIEKILERTYGGNVRLVDTSHGQKELLLNS